MIRRLCLWLLLVLAVSCGGGGSIEKDTSGGTSTATDGYAISLTMQDSNGNDLREVSTVTPGRLIATLTNNGTPVSFEIVNFSLGSIGVLNPTQGTALTDENGQAVISLLPGSNQGAGIATASFSVGDDNVSGTFSFTSSGDAPSGSSGDFLLSLDIVDANNNTITNVTAAAPGIVLAQVTDGSGTPVASRVVQFSSSLGSFTPESGTALTDSNGNANIILNAGTVEGAAEVTASFEGVSIVSGFYTQGDEIEPSTLEADVSFMILDCPDGWDRTVRDASLCTETSNISPSSPGIIYIQANRDGSTIPLSETLVFAETTIGKISPDTKTSITDSNGVALLDILATNDVGAGEITVTAINTSVARAFQIGAADVSLAIDNGLSTGVSLDAGSTTVITVTITDNDSGGLYQPPVNVEFTSSCANAGQAVLDEQVTSVGGIASGTYRANGCVGDDQISATAIVGGESLVLNTTVTVTAADTGSIQFVSASTQNIALRGTGGLETGTDDVLVPRSETSVLQFRVVDENGNPDPQVDVSFLLTTEIGGMSISPTQASTNNEGLVQTVVTAGDIPTSVRVLAIYDPGNGGNPANNNRISAPSDTLVVSTGLPDSNSLTLSVSNHSPEALERTGSNTDATDVATVTVNGYAADAQNNPVPDGTVIYFTTEGGAIEDSCQTTNGACSVLWWSQNPKTFTDAGYANAYTNVGGTGCFRDFDNDNIRDTGEDFGPCLPAEIAVLYDANNSLPPPKGARSTVTAHAVGVESFNDLNGNGVFDSGEFASIYDLSEAFIDHNENGAYDGISCSDASNPCDPANSDGGEYEFSFDYDADGSFDTADNVYTGLACTSASQTSGDCNWEMLHVWDEEVIVMSGSAMGFRTLNSAGVDINSITITKGDAGSFTVYVGDLYNNRPPSGSTLAASSTIGTIDTPEVTIADSSSFGAVASSVSLSISATESKNSGIITVTLTTPSGVESSVTVAVTAL